MMLMVLDVLRTDSLVERDRSTEATLKHAKKPNTKPGSNRKYGKMYHFIYLLRNTNNANVLYKAPNLQRFPSPDVLDDSK